MILQDIYDHLQSDSGLATLLGATGSDSKIYPQIAKETADAPFIVYRSANPGGTKDEVLSEELITLVITANDFEKIVSITQAITDLLDLKETAEISSTLYEIYYSKKIGGSDFSDELHNFNRSLTFLVKFKKQ